jgi:malate dehydrogenase (oxaloacetate-decarboxylating)
LSSAAEQTGTPLTEQRMVMLGTGSAAVGVADMIRAAMVHDGLDPQQAADRFWLVSRKGLMLRSCQGLSPEQQVYARPDAETAGWKVSSEAGPDLAETVARVRPTTLIGLSTARGAFTEDIVRQMAANCPQPVIFPLSNLTSHSEADPADLARWTRGKALVATGSPFPAGTAQSRTTPVAQANNVYVFPAVGLAVTARPSRRPGGCRTTAAEAARAPVNHMSP